ncbi:MAG: STAS domain-containing protein [Syntrophales bacterium]
MIINQSCDSELIVSSGGMDFIVAARKAGPNTSILDIRGVINISCENTLCKAFGEAMEGSGNILLNLSGLGHMDVEGAGVLLMNAVRAAGNNIGVAACGLTNTFRDVFHITGLDEVMAIYGDEKEAIGDGRFLEMSSSARPLPKDQDSPLRGWSKSIDRLSLTGIPAAAMNINVNGRRTSNPANGFGRLWDKRYRLRLNDANLDPRQLASLWRSEFPAFWPQGNYVYPSGKASLAPGTAALLNLTLPGGLVLATGLMVIYADDTSFSFMTAEGHILSGWITFSCFREDASTFIQVHPLFRSSDPLMEMSLRLGAAVQEDRFWHETLGNIARRLGTYGEVVQQDMLVDPHIQWKRFTNIRYSAAIRSSLYMPVYMLKRCLVRKDTSRNVNP